MKYQFKTGDTGKLYGISATYQIIQELHHTDTTPKHFAVVITHADGSQGVVSVDHNGKCFLDPDCNLLPPAPTVEKSRFFNCYVAGHSVYAHDTLEQARAGRVTLHGEESSNVIGTVEVQIMSYGPPNLIFHEKRE